ncbi:hypothetical protein EHS13_31835 [Paenibacillus psychroresistens]|uniref:Uncharacterized protein n=1 Tax=Paenibacillus psychroresistens TaxID=1778678 RepID=A0A6B8RUL8_9BACL|nr:hypothetical protein [Paenibacillus psychroresistens]QGQ99143.1 hypothetical protein EHS13_31835 [Paenibacillus psychroresistens]
MRAWAAVFKKDFKLTRTVFFAGLVINLLMVMLSIFVGMKTDSLFMFIPVAAAIIFHVLYIPIMLLISLKTEANQLHLWLHNPQPASTLLSSKLVNGLTMMVVSLLTLYAMTGLLIKQKFSLIELYWTDTWTAGLLFSLYIIIISITIGIGVLFLWTLFQFLKFKIGRRSWLVVIGTAVILFWLKVLLESTELYNLIVNWGVVTYTFPSFTIDKPIQTYTGEYLYDIIIIIGSFVLTAWFFDKKAEV